MERDERIYMKKGDRILLHTDTFLIDGVVGSGTSSICYTAYRQQKKGRLKELYPVSQGCHLERMENNRLRACDKRSKKIFAGCCEDFTEAYRKLEQAKNANEQNEKLNNYIPPFELYSVEGEDGEKGVYVFTPDDKVGVDFETYLRKVHQNQKDVEIKMYHILSVLLTLTDAVKMFHEADLLHLDIKGSNLLISYNSNFELNTGMISLFDINSLYAMRDVRPVTAGTSGYSAPEAERGQPNNYSDVYSIGAVLFHSLFLSEEDIQQGLYCREYYSRLDTLVASSRFLDTAAATRDIFFRTRIADILKNCLAESPEARYGSCEDLMEDLEQARALLLPAVEGKKLGSGRELAIIEREKTYDPYCSIQHLLYRRPLYDWKQADTMDVLVVGSGNNAQHFLDIALQTGQVADSRLRIRVVSDEAHLDEKIYCRFRPALERFVDINGSMRGSKETPYGEVEFRRIGKFSETDSGRNIAMAESLLQERKAGYIFISLGEDGRNRMAASAFEKAVDQLGLHCAVNYVVYEKGEELQQAEPLYLDGSEETFDPELERMAYLTHSSWSDKKNDAKTLKKEFRERYNHRSSTAFALSIAYKLKSIGISAADLQQAADLFAEKRKDETIFQRMTALEHRRWLLEKLTEGWGAPADAQGRPDYTDCVRNSVKDKVRKLHPCIVRSREETPLQKEPFRSNIGGVWENPGEWDEGLDDLDRMSVELHRCFWQEAKKIRDKMPLEKGDFLVLKNDLRHVGDELALQEYEICLKEILEGSAAAVERLSAAEAGLLQSLQGTLRKETETRMQQIRSTFFPAMESNLRRDYKSNDMVLTDRLPYILTYRPHINMAMAFGESIVCLEQILGLRPKKMTFLAYIRNMAEGDAFVKRAMDFLHTCRMRRADTKITFLIGTAAEYDFTQLQDAKVFFCQNEKDGVKQFGRHLFSRKIDFFSLETELFSEKTEAVWENLLKQKLCCDASAGFLKYWQNEEFLRTEDVFRLEGRELQKADVLEKAYLRMWPIYQKAGGDVWKRLCRHLGTYAEKTDILAEILLTEEKMQEQTERICFPADRNEFAEHLLEQLKQTGIVSMTSAVRRELPDVSVMELTTEFRLDGLEDVLFDHKIKEKCLYLRRRENRLQICGEGLAVKGLLLEDDLAAVLYRLQEEGFLSSIRKTAGGYDFYFNSPKVRKLLTNEKELPAVWTYYELQGRFDDICMTKDGRILLTKGFRAEFWDAEQITEKMR